MLLDALAKIRQFWLNTYFLTCSAAEFYWTEIVKDVARQYGRKFTNGGMNAMD